MAARSRRTCTFRYSASAVFAFLAFSTRFTAVRSLERAARLRAFAFRLKRTRFFALLRFGNSVLSTLWILAHGFVQRSAESIDETKDPIKNRAGGGTGPIPFRWAGRSRRLSPPRISSRHATFVGSPSTPFLDRCS